MNEILREQGEAEAKKTETKRRFKVLKLQTTDEVRRNGREGKPTDDQKTINEVLFEYLVKLKMGLPDGKNTLECNYWWRYNYLEGKLTKEFESYKEISVAR